MQLIAFLGSLIMSVMTAQAQDQDTTKMARLAFLVSDWEVVPSEEALKSTTSSISWVHDGQFIEEHVKHLTKYGEINMITFIGYDARIQSYKLTAMDKEYGQMDVYVGDWEDDQLIFTNITSDAPIQMPDGQPLNFRITYFDINKDSFSHKVEGTYDQGATWFTFSINQYRRSD